MNNNIETIPVNEGAIFEDKSNGTIKQIAVSSTNLTLDANGVAPLGKEFAPVVEAAQAQPVPTMPAPEAPVAQEVAQPEVAPAAPEAPVQAPAMPEVPVQEPVMPASPQTEEVIENIDYNKPASDVITEPAVDVVSSTGLDSFDFNFNPADMIPDVQVPTVETPAAPVVEMPQMDAVVNAQEPTLEDNRLFETTPMEPAMPAPAAPAVETPVVPETPVQEPAEIPAMDAVVADNPFIVPGDAPEQGVVLDNPMTMEPAMPEVPSAPETPVVETPVVPEAPAVTLPELGEEVSVPEAPIMPEMPTTSVFDDHMPIPEEVASTFNIPTVDNPTEEEVFPSLETSVDEVKEETPEKAKSYKELLENFKADLAHMVQKIDEDIAKLENDRVELNEEKEEEVISAPLDLEPEQKPVDPALESLGIPSVTETPVMETTVMPEVQEEPSMSVNEEPIQGNKFIF